MIRRHAEVKVQVLIRGLGVLLCLVLLELAK